MTQSHRTQSACAVLRRCACCTGCASARAALLRLMHLDIGNDGRVLRGVGELPGDLRLWLQRRELIRDVGATMATLISGYTHASPAEVWRATGPPSAQETTARASPRPWLSTRSVRVSNRRHDRGPEGFRNFSLSFGHLAESAPSCVSSNDPQEPVALASS